jgi:hypothetical protein
LLVDRVVAIGRRVAPHGFLGDLLDAHALDRRGGAGEVLVHEGGAEADRVEDLRAAIGLIGRDAHLGHDLEDALADRLDVVLLHVLGGERQFLVHGSLPASRTPGTG